MTKEEIILKFKKWYYLNYDENRKLLDESKREHDLFLSTFTIEKVQKMFKNDYVVGKGNQNSFCYWVEKKLEMLGEMAIRGSSNYGLYWSKDKHCFVSRYEYTHIDQIFKKIKKDILQIITNAQENTNVQVENMSFIDRFGLKIYYLYNSSNCLPVYSKNHIDLLLKEFELEDSKTSSSGVVDKNLMLFRFYKELNIEEMTPLLFVRFLYDYEYGFGSLLKPSKRSALLKANDQKEEIIDLLKNRKRNKFGNYHDDETSLKETKEVGDKGQERAKLYFEEHKKVLHIKEITYPGYDGADKNDAAGCDIIYKTNDGIKHFCEVKARKRNNISFFMTSNEWETMCSHKETYEVMFYPNVLTQDKFWIFIYKDLADKKHPTKYKFDLKIL